MPLICTDYKVVYWISYHKGIRSNGSQANKASKTWDLVQDNTALNIIITAQLNNLEMGIVEIHRSNGGWTAGTILDSYSAN